MKYNALGRTDIRISGVSYGGIVSAGFYDNVHYPTEGQAASDRYVAWAVDHGVNYFDVAPGYGNAQDQLGVSLRPYRKDVYLACKTAFRTRAEAEADMERSLRLLKTDCFDVYQLHGVASMEEVETAFGPGGVMELMVRAKEQGLTR